MRRISLEQHTQWHDQWILFMVAKQAPQGGFDYAMMEKNARLVSLLKKDALGQLIEVMPDGTPRPMVGIPYLDRLVMEDADWTALCEKFRAHRWAVHDDEILALGKKLLEAPEYKPNGQEDEHAAGEHRPPAGNGSGHPAV